MGRVGIEKTAAIGAQQLDRFLGGHGPHGDSCLLDDHLVNDLFAVPIELRVPQFVQLQAVDDGFLDEGYVLGSGEVLDHSLRDQ